MIFKKNNFFRHQQLLDQIRRNPRLLPSNRRLNIFDTNINLGRKERQRASREKQSLFQLPSTRFPVFTQNFKYLGSIFRFALKPWASGTAFGSYTMPFYFDRQRWLSYRVQARPLAFPFDREQRKYFLSFDLGTKNPLTISSRRFFKFGSPQTFGRLSYTRTTSRHFLKTLGKKGSFSLYAPPQALANSTYFKTSLLSFPYNWASDVLPLVFKHRFTFNRKIQVQSEDLDLFVSGSQFSWTQAFAKGSTPSAFYPLLPQRYSSFLISSPLKTKRVGFPYRFFRYYHKYFLRKQHWSGLLESFWGRFWGGFSSKSFFPWRTFSSVLMRSGFPLFFGIKFFLQCFYLLVPTFVGISFSAHARAFYSFLFGGLGNMVGLFFTKPWSSIFEEGSLALFSSAKSMEPSLGCPPNALFLVKPWAKKYLVIQLGNQVRFFARHGYYNPWRKRFVFSLKNYAFLKVFPQFSGLRRRNASARGHFQKNLYKRDWFLFDLFNGAQHRIISLFGRFLLFFARKHSAPHLFSSKLPLFLKYFFKVSRKLLGGGNSYLQEVFSLSKVFSPQRRLSPSWRPMFSFLQRGALALAKQLRGLRKRSRSLRSPFRPKRLLFLHGQVRKQLLQFASVLWRFKTTLKNNFPRRRPRNSRWWRRYPFPSFLTKSPLPLGKTTLKTKRLYEARSLLGHFLKLNYWKFPPRLLKGVMLFRLLVPSFLRRRPPGIKRRRLPYYTYHGLRMIKRLFKAHRRFFSSWWKGMRLELRGRRPLIKSFFTRLALSSANTTSNAFSPRVFYWLRLWTAFFHCRGLVRALVVKPITWNFSYPSLPSLASPLLASRGKIPTAFFRLGLRKSIKANVSFNFTPLHRLQERLFLKVRPRFGWRTKVAQKFKDEQKLIAFFLGLAPHKRRRALPPALYRQIKYAMPPHPPKKRNYRKKNFARKNNFPRSKNKKTRGFGEHDDVEQLTGLKLSAASSEAPVHPALQKPEALFAGWGALISRLEGSRPKTELEGSRPNNEPKVFSSPLPAAAFFNKRRTEPQATSSPQAGHALFKKGQGNAPDPRSRKPRNYFYQPSRKFSWFTQNPGSGTSTSNSTTTSDAVTLGEEKIKSEGTLTLEVTPPLTLRERKIKRKAMLYDKTLGPDGRPLLWQHLIKKNNKKAERYSNLERFRKVPPRKPTPEGLEFARQAFADALAKEKLSEKEKNPDLAEAKPSSSVDNALGTDNTGSSKNSNKTSP